MWTEENATTKNENTQNVYGASSYMWKTKMIKISKWKTKHSCLSGFPTTNYTVYMKTDKN